MLERQGVLSSWHDRQIAPGSNWAGQIDQQLEQAQIILLLVSSDFLASNYCYDIELGRALERHEAGEAVVVPVILRSVDWQGAPFRRLQALPKNGEPVTAWGDRDAAFTDVARGIRRVVMDLQNRAAHSQQPEAAPKIEANPTDAARAQTVASPENLEIPEGQVPLSSPFYVERPPIEADCYRAIVQPSALIRIKAPRQMGKSSLMARILHHANQQGYRTVSISFQEADSEIFSELTGFLQWFCATVADALGLPDQLEQHWSGILGSKQKCSNYFYHYILNNSSQPLVLGLDEVDLVLRYPKTSEEFFSMLRAWHEKKNDKNWQNLRMAITHSSDVYIPHQINKSAFNIGLSKELGDFTHSQIRQLSSLHGLDLSSQVNRLAELTGGHPYLTRIALYQLSKIGFSLDELISISLLDDGPYAEHFLVHTRNLENEKYLAKALYEITQSDEAIRVDSAIALRLQSMGLVKFSQGGVRPFCSLYRKFFRRYFSDYFENDL
jgi:hypothetical protein